MRTAPQFLSPHRFSSSPFLRFVPHAGSFFVCVFLFPFFFNFSKNSAVFLVFMVFSEVFLWRKFGKIFCFSAVIENEL
jgi:hypothetical protein